MLMPNGQISDPQQDLPAHPMLGLAFRPLFLLGAFFATFSIAVWAAFLNGHLMFTPYGGLYWWHMHEMLFGFASAIIVGFLLTAVQVWTKVASVKGTALAGLVAIWAAARLLLLFPSGPAWLQILVDCSFLPIAAYCLFKRLWQVRQTRNLFFVPVLLIMALANAGMHWALIKGQSELIPFTAYLMILLVTLVMCIMGGRIFPMFTANGTKTAKVAPIKWLEIAAIASIVCVILTHLFSIWIPAELNAGLLIFAGLINAMRALRWRAYLTWQYPLLWPLHLSYWAICIGLVMLGLSRITTLCSSSQALHAITVGGMGIMILAMISRVSLGHTGRKLVANKWMKLAFIFISLSFFFRVFGSYFLPTYPVLIVLSAAGWIGAYGLFCISYWSVLTQPRVDGLPG